MIAVEPRLDGMIAGIPVVVTVKLGSGEHWLSWAIG